MLAVSKEINNKAGYLLSLTHKSCNLRPVLPNANSSMADGVMNKSLPNVKKFVVNVRATETK